MKFLLSNGLSTDRIEYYVIDLFKLYLKVYPGDIPGFYSFGFNFNMKGIMKKDLPDEVKSRVDRLIELIQNNFSSGVRIELESCELLNETKAKVIINVNQIKSDGIEINLYEE